jgi:acyl-CoA thioester hydrolase
VTDAPMLPPPRRPDPRRTELDRYPFAVELQTRWGDMDSQRHLNNVMLGRYYEESRIRFIHEVSDGAPERFSGMVGAVYVDYLREARHPEPLVGAVGVGAVGRSSVRLLQALFQHGACVGVADVTLVVIDPETRAAAPVPEDWRALFGARHVRGTSPGRDG